jgi:hypothetical protein
LAKYSILFPIKTSKIIEKIEKVENTAKVDGTEEEGRRRTKDGAKRAAVWDLGEGREELQH